MDASTGEIQSIVVWTETPHEVHIHLAGSSHKLGLALDGMAGLGDRVARHGGRLILKAVGSAELHGDSAGSALPCPGTWEKLVPPKLRAPLAPPRLASPQPGPPAIHGPNLHHQTHCEDICRQGWEHSKGSGGWGNCGDRWFYSNPCCGLSRQRQRPAVGKANAINKGLRCIGHDPCVTLAFWLDLGRRRSSSSSSMYLARIRQSQTTCSTYPELDHK